MKIEAERLEIIPLPCPWRWLCAWGIGLLTGILCAWAVVHFRYVVLDNRDLPGLCFTHDGVVYQCMVRGMEVRHMRNDSTWRELRPWRVKAQVDTVKHR